MPDQKQVQLAVRIREDVHRAAKMHASMKGISLATFVEQALVNAFDSTLVRFLERSLPSPAVSRRGGK